MSRPLGLSFADATGYPALGLYACHWVEGDGWLVIHVYAETPEQTLEHCGFLVEWVGDASKTEVDHRVDDVVQDWQPPRPPKALTSAALRLMTSHTGEANRLARQELDGLLALLGKGHYRPRRRPKVRLGDVRDDRWYAELIDRYAALEGPGARRRLATQVGAPASTVRNWITEATTRGLWAGGAPGRRGQMTQKCRDILSEGN